jgi:hypothetical protein
MKCFEESRTIKKAEIISKIWYDQMNLDGIYKITYIIICPKLSTYFQVVIVNK